MITEYDAKNRWCPFARLSEMGGTFNRCGPAANVECIGSQCMAWRWDSSRGPGPVEEYTVPVGGNPANLPDRPGFRWNAGKKDAEGVHWGLFPRLGYCGLAAPGQS